MKHPRFTAWLCSAAALVLLAVPAFAQQPDALPPEQAAPAAQEQPAEAAAPDAEAPLRKLLSPLRKPLPGRPPILSAPMWRWATASFPAWVCRISSTPKPPSA